MKAQVLRKHAPIQTRPLELADLPVPTPGPGEILVKVSACGVCHTEIDEIEGRLSPRLPVIPGHEIVGRVEATRGDPKRFRTGERVGIAWIHSACGSCRFCSSGLENLCTSFEATGCDAPGGYAEYTVVNEGYACAIPERFSDMQAAPLLCAGAIGYRDLKMTGVKAGQTLGLFGFGASAHIVLQAARYCGAEVYVFTRGDEHRRLAIHLGAEWAGKPEEEPPHKVDAAIDFTPAGETVPAALSVLEKGGRLVIAVIRKDTPVPAMDYDRLMWNEKEIKSVANITRADVTEFLAQADRIPIMTEVEEYPLEKANDALIALKEGKVRGAAVLRIADGGSR